MIYDLKELEKILSKKKIDQFQELFTLFQYYDKLDMIIELSKNKWVFKLIKKFVKPFEKSDLRKDF